MSDQGNQGRPVREEAQAGNGHYDKEGGGIPVQQPFSQAVAPDHHSGTWFLEFVATDDQMKNTMTARTTPISHGE